MRKRTVIALLVAVTFLLTGLASAYAQQDIRLGVLAKRGVAKAQEKWGPTAKYLGERLKTRCVLVPLKFVEIEPALKSNEIDFLLANSAFYARFKDKYGFKAISTMINRKKDIALKQFAGVLFVRSDSSIKRVQDIKGKKLMGVKYSSFGGAQMAWRLLLEQGVNPKKDCSGFIQGGNPRQGRTGHRAAGG